jgi:hypothetical protein
MRRSMVCRRVASSGSGGPHRGGTVVHAAVLFDKYRDVLRRRTFARGRDDAPDARRGGSSRARRLIISSRERASLS